MVRLQAHLRFSMVGQGGIKTEERKSVFRLLWTITTVLIALRVFRSGSGNKPVAGRTILDILSRPYDGLNDANEKLDI